MNEKKAPGAAVTAAEGETGTINVEGHRLIMNDTTCTAATRTMTPEQADFAARFADYEVVVRIAHKTAEPERNHDGSWFLPVGAVKISPRLGRITIIIVEGAGVEHMQMLRAGVENFRAGKEWQRFFNRLVAVTDDDMGVWYRTSWLGWTAPERWLDSEGMRVTRCDDETCVEGWHEYDSTTALGAPDVLHHGERIQHAAGLYEVSLSRMTGQPWRVDVEVNEYALNAFAARSLANDINWLSAECEKLNAAEVAA